MLSQLYKTLQSTDKLGKDTVLPDRGDDALYLSEYGEVFCFIGVCEINRERRHLLSWPYYMNGKHSSKYSAQMLGIYRLTSGCVRLSRFLDHELYAEKKFKHLVEYAVRLPVPASCYYDVHKIGDGSSYNSEENEDLTRAAFGLTYQELKQLTQSYAKAFGIDNDWVQYPKITRSVSRDNYCDITGAWIPASFPYIAFSQSDYRYSHVSLYGFYHHVGALLAYGSKTAKVLDSCLDKDLAEKVKNIDSYFPLEPAVTREVIVPTYILGNVGKSQ